ncbi:RDD family protein [Flavobacterium eburneipallidum]|uniref:RDD family protein n=1 Tax=Flavobacterium eburneipallidum TaxID=3003263 RepID=UPI0022AC9018|nr:RDD family protein [Flavobacterium eburneipallidum]
MKKKDIIPNYILASKNTRFLNFIIDLFFIYILSLMVYFLLSFVKFDNVYPYFSDWIDTFNHSENFIFHSIIWFFYYGLTEFFLSRTVAKYFTKTIVVLKDGSKPKLKNILARTVLRIVPYEHFTFLGGRRLGLHDESSETFVVKKEKLEKFILNRNT